MFSNIFRLKKKIYQWLEFVAHSATLQRIVGFLADKKIISKRNKYFNYILNSNDYFFKRRVAMSGPMSATLNVTNICNYRCKFCEIHYFYKFAKEQSGQVFANDLTVAELKQHHDWLKNIFNLELSGATGEPFANPHFLEIVKYLKTTYPGMILTATTNGSMITEAVADEIIKNKFDFLLFSVHGGNADTYKMLQNGDLHKILFTLKMLSTKKKQYSARSPRLAINFALHKLNVDSIFNLIDKVKEMELDLDYIHVQHYYDGRNDMDSVGGGQPISYYFDIEAGNKKLDEIYAYAREKNVALYPKKPLYLNVTPPEGGVQQSCREPWRCFKIKGCVEENGKVYIGVCNRIILFKLDTQKFYAQGGKVEDIWQHPVLQYLRQNVGATAICQFCLDPKTVARRCLNKKEYANLRDQAVQRFFQECRAGTATMLEIPGLELLERNPYEFSD